MPRWFMANPYVQIQVSVSQHVEWVDHGVSPPRAPPTAHNDDQNVLYYQIPTNV